MRPFTIEPGHVIDDPADVIITEDIKVGDQRIRKGRRLQDSDVSLHQGFDDLREHGGRRGTSVDPRVLVQDAVGHDDHLLASGIRKHRSALFCFFAHPFPPGKLDHFLSRAVWLLPIAVGLSAISRPTFFAESRVSPNCSSET